MAKFLDFESKEPNAAIMVNNYDWMKDFTFLDFAREVGKHITVNYMMAKESVQQRLNGTARDGLSFTEFTYQLLYPYSKVVDKLEILKVFRPSENTFLQPFKKIVNVSV